jgi:alpha-1,2-mannosyltransferase
MIDLQVYRWGGEMARHHRNVYDLKFEGFLSFTYTPLAVLAFELMSHLSLGVLRFVLTGASIGALLGALWVAFGMAGVAGAGQRGIRAGLTFATAGVVLGLEPVTQTLGFGQINLLLMVLVLADLAQPDGRRWKGAGVGLAAAVKLTPAIFIGYLVLTRRFRAAAVACMTFGAAVALGFLALPAPSRRFWFGGLFLNSERVGGVGYAGNQSVNGALVRLFAGVNQARPAWLLAAAVIGGAGLLLAAWASRRGEELLGIATCALTALLVSPISWSHHWVWVVLLVPCGVRLLRGSRSALGWIGGWLGLAGLVALFLAGPVRLIWRPPHTGNLEYAWHGAQLIAGNLYILLGLLLLGMTAVFLGRSRLRPDP